MSSNFNVKSILEALSQTPRILQELIDEIPKDRYKKHIIHGKWTIHEHATHVAVGDIYGFQKRLEQFKHVEKPMFEPLSGENFAKDFFLELDLQSSLQEFFKVRAKTIQMAQSLDDTQWGKEANHPEYTKYTPYIMVRHLLMHDHAHLYKIEDMGFGIGHIS